MKSKTLRQLGKQAITWTAIFLVSFMGSPVLANPFGGVVQSGNATISGAGNTVTINQQSGRAVINWNGFSIGAGEITRFNQPGSNAAILNRVTGGNPSAILGQLQANGNVFVINPSGVLIGNGAQINVGGFTASTLDVSNSQFMRGGALDFRGDSQAGVVNYGTINANGGNIFLIGSSVENHGTLNAPGGTVGLAAGQHVRLADSANPNLVVKAGSASLSHSVANSGNINALRAELAANGGNVYGLAINNTGTIRATGATTVGGEVYLTAPGGTIQNSGDIIASQGASGGKVVLDTRSPQGQLRTGETQVSGSINTSGDTGGTVHILGDQVALSSATINASGLNGGGKVLIGGGYQGATIAGSDPGLNQNAINTSVDAESTINASAINTGDGGRVNVWADDTAEFFGHANVRGGTLAGNGGFVEVSGRELLNYDGTVNLLGPTGENGTLLLDPRNVEVQFLLAPPNPGFSRVTPLAIVLALATGNVVVHTSFTPDPGQAGDLQINAPVLYDSANSLSFFAHGDIDANASVLNNGAGDVNLVAGWNGMTGFAPINALPQPMTAADMNAVFANQMSFGNNNGSINIGDGTQLLGIAVGSRFGDTNVAGFDLNVTAGNAGIAPFAQLGSRKALANFDINGDINIALRGDLTATAGDIANSYAQVGHGGLDFTPLTFEPDGNFMGDINVLQANNISLMGGAGTDAYAQIGHGGADTTGNQMGDITIAARDLTVMGGSALQAYAQVGHGGTDSDGNRTGTFNLNLDGNMMFTGGSAESAYAQLGHGGFSSAGDILGAINLNTDGNITFTGGSATSTFAQLGNGGDDSAGDRNGAIEIFTVGNIAFNGGSGDIAFAQIGHNGFAGDQSDDITITGVQNIDFTGGGGLFSFAQLGHQGFGAMPATNQTGVISIEDAADITFTGGMGELAFAQLGHSAFTGDQLGLIQVNSNSIFFAGGSGEDAYAQLGHGGGGDIVAMQRNGEIVVNTGNLIFTGGSGESTFAQLGHGGDNSTGDNTGDIGITALDIRFTGGTAENAFAQLGHGGNEAAGNTVGNFNINADDITFRGGIENDTYAQLGHGGDNADADHDGDFDITASGVVFFNAGSGDDAYAQLGNGGNELDGQASGQISVSADTITFIANQLANAGNDDDTYAQLGHGGNNADGALFGDITVSSMNDITFTGGNDTNGFAQLGHGGRDADGGHLGDILIQNANDVVFTGGMGFRSYAQLGHGGAMATADQTGDITVVMANDIRLQGGAGFGASAQLGHGGRGIEGDQMGSILISQANIISLIGGIGEESYSQLGHGGTAFLTDGAGFTIANQTGDITITQANDINITGGSSFASYAQLGHGGATSLGNQMGDISVRLVGSDLTLTAGIATAAYAQLGHGDASGAGTGIRTGDINVIIDGTASLTGESMTSFAWIGHRSAAMNGVSGNLVLAVDQLDPLNDGGGRLLMNNEFTALDMAGAPNEVRLFDTRRDGPSPQFIAQNALVNGVLFDIANQQPEFFSDANEQWGSSTTFTLASPGPYTGPSTFFYIGRDLVLTADDLARFYGDANPNFTFTTTGLQGGDTLATALNGTPMLGTTANAFTGVGTAAITFLNGGALSANGYNLVLVNGELTINPAPLVVTANNQTKVYGDTFNFNGSEFTAAGLKNGETIGSVDLASAGAVATANVAGSPYAITAANAQGGTFDSNNYTISYVNGQLNITPAPLILTANDQTKLQGTLFVFNGTEFLAVGLQNGDTIGTVDLSSLGAAPSAGVGAFPINIANPQGAFDPANYDITLVPGTLNVLPAMQPPGNQITITPISGGKFLISGFGPTPFITAPEEIYWRWTAHEFLARTLYNAWPGMNRPSQISVIRKDRPTDEITGQSSP